MPKTLIHACKKGYLEMVELLLTNPSNPANVNIDSEYEEPGRKYITRPIWVAVETNNLELLQLLLRRAVNMDLECTKMTLECNRYNDEYENVITPLWRAVWLQQVAMEQELIKAGANMNAQRITRIISNGEIRKDTFITHAVIHNKMGLCHRLVQYGFDLTAKRVAPKCSHTALDLAIEDNSSEIVDFLLQHLPKHADILGSAINTAISCNQPKYIRALIQHGCKLWHHWCPVVYVCRNTDGLMHGINVSAEESCVTLLQYGCKVETSTEHFHLAVKKGLIGLIYNMVQLNPQVLQQSWLRDCDDFGELPHQAVNWLHKQSRQPAPLKDLCKASILQDLGSLVSSENMQPHIPTLISKLPLPMLLQQFLQFTSIADAHDDIGI